MPEDKKYSFITVNSDTEEEIVIQAGRVFTASEEDDPQEEAAAPASPPKTQEASQPPKGSEDKAKASEDAYRATTIEDLQASGPFPKTRIAVIACAILIVVAVVIYYNFIA
ncbi:MAG: hypothetical protein FWE65_04165 [Eggerthellaceae bacterium]|nr:hypothetical protein [Eggerthellaceae bacterium]